MRAESCSFIWQPKVTIENLAMELSGRTVAKPADWATGRLGYGAVGADTSGNCWWYRSVRADCPAV